MIKCNHTSVGVIVERLGTFLIFRRVKPPYGFAPCAGHVEEGETYQQAAIRELEEETGLVAKSLVQVWAVDMPNSCRREDGFHHVWNVYLADVEVDAVARGKDDESTNLRWLTGTEIEALIRRTRTYEQGLITPEEWQAEPGMEPVWAHFFDVIGITWLSGILRR